MADPAPKRVEHPRRLEHAVEFTLFGSRWLLAPLYLGLVVVLAAIVVKFVQELWALLVHLTEEDGNDLMLGILGLLDLVLLSNLVLIVILAGYENFVSRIAAARDVEDRPRWMNHIDFSGLKMKIIGSIVAISAIGLLRDFTDIGTAKALDASELVWRIALHVTFLLSGVGFAFADWLAEKRTALTMVTHSED
ncbi:TIGR00645 family protein [Gryllotalpicola sp.]|uniref:TIGR00645 family protein n=1 Tax=Gryllotalpicola sp. TaxID=1932787 RepID=UPI0026159EDD|nr:TIGR00645 family protein [Gryllotalpicola sp.]